MIKVHEDIREEYTRVDSRETHTISVEMEDVLLAIFCLIGLVESLFFSFCSSYEFAKIILAKDGISCNIVIHKNDEATKAKAENGSSRRAHTHTKESNYL